VQFLVLKAQANLDSGLFGREDKTDLHAAGLIILDFGTACTLPGSTSPCTLHDKRNYVPSVFFFFDDDVSVWPDVPIFGPSNRSRSFQLEQFLLSHQR
jgi:hypothetical protein